MSKRYVIGIDPSGSFKEGKGTTGWCVLDTASRWVVNSMETRARPFNTAEDYWQAHLDLLDSLKSEYDRDIVLSIEDYLLYGSKAKSQTNSTMETSQLIGILKMWAKVNRIPYTIRPAVIAKKRWTNKIMEHKGYITKFGKGYMNSQKQPLVSHTLDAMRHALHCMYFENKEEKYK